MSSDTAKVSALSELHQLYSKAMADMEQVIKRMEDTVTRLHGVASEPVIQAPVEASGLIGKLHMLRVQAENLVARGEMAITKLEEVL